jgi:hypothetical protein
LPQGVQTAIFLFGKVHFAKQKARKSSRRDFVNQDTELAIKHKQNKKKVREKKRTPVHAAELRFLFINSRIDMHSFFFDDSVVGFKIKYN